MYGTDDDASKMLDESSRTKITHAQKTKYVIHIRIVAIIHFLIFWYIPIQGNIKLYKKPICDRNVFGCRNFQDNGFLRVFYLLVCVYFYFSAVQIRAGFPLLKKASSLMQYDDSVLAL